MIRCAVENRASTGALSHREIHLWTVDLNACVDTEVRGLLSATEQATADRHRHQPARARFIARRVALRRILARYAGVTPSALQFAANAYGKPELLGLSERINLAFNTSHSGPIAVIAVGAVEPLGIDIEELREDVEIDAIAARFFAAGEAAAIAQLSHTQRVLAFYNAWTRKEAVVKALGKGLSIALDRFEVSVRPGAAPAVIRCDFHPRLGERLQLHHLEFGNGYIGALASAAGEFTLRQSAFDWHTL